jgi:ankyrin repeat protein
VKRFALLLSLLCVHCFLLSCQKNPEKIQEQLHREGIALTPERLIQAAAQSDTLTLQRMIQAGMDPNSTTPDGRTPLITAAEHNHVFVMKLLLDRNVPVHQTLPDGRNALHLAAVQGHLESVQFLLNKQLSADQPDLQGRTPLSEAASNNHVAVMKILLAASTDEQLRVKNDKLQNKQSPAPNSFFLSSKQTPTPTPLPPNILSPEKVTSPIQSPLASALENGHEDLALQLLESGFDFQETRIHGQPLLAWAIATQQKRFFNKLLEKGAHPDTLLKTPASNAFIAKVNNAPFHYYLKQDHKVTVLMLAAALGETECVDTLLLKGAQKNLLTSKHKSSAIYFAGTNKHASIVQLLLGKSFQAKDQRHKIEVSLSKQKAVLYQDGKALLHTPISSGRKGFKTPKGTFVITNKYKDWVSTIYDSEMPYFMRLNCGAIGLHAGALPGYPASHGCIRLPYAKAKEFFGTVEVGTLVHIID